ncbi:MAG: hypothetical protein ABIN97_05045, partial [Ginsengibacter sp.]
LKVKNATLLPDNAVLASLEKTHTAPDDVFKISFSSLSVNGIGIEDLLNKNEIDIKKIYLDHPVIEIYHTNRPYNKSEREKNDSLTLYQRLMRGMKRISIDTIMLEHGTFVNHNISRKNKITRFNDVTVKANGLLVDSTTQYNRDRFLFAKDADISFKDYTIPTPDSLYYFRAGSINISAAKHTLAALNISLTPRGNREQFKKKLKQRQDLFTIKTQKFTLNEIDWYSILNEDKIIAKEGTIKGCNFSDFFDRRLPRSATTSTLTNFPHQLLMRMSLPVYIEKINLENCTIKYEEFNPAAEASGIIYFDNVNGQLSNITNMPEYIRNNNKIKLQANALFMNKVKFNIVFNLDLKNYKTGNFTVDVALGETYNSLINPIAEPLGLISVKKGIIKKVVAHIAGTDTLGTGNVLLLYDDLHLVPLKKNKDGGLKKKNITSFIANLLLIKNSNPSKGKEQRQEDCNYKKDLNGSFFNFIWKIILTGVLKTIGIPVKLAYK